MKGRLVIRRTAQGFSCDWTGTPESPQMFRLFGSTILPTPFTHLSTMSHVIRVIQGLNPMYDVVAEEDE
jgi:hypothetical protein